MMNNATYGLEIASGSVLTYKDNRISGNGTNTISAPLTTATLF
jgi:hypothetical protein